MSLTLYYSPASCAMASHIALIEAGLPFELVKVDMKNRTLPDGSSFAAVAPKNKVPLLRLVNGEFLSEGPAILQYIADQAPSSGLAAQAGTMARYRLLEMLNFLTSDVHKSFSPLFSSEMPDEIKAKFRAIVAKHLDLLSEELTARAYLVGDGFTVADCYLLVILGWCSPRTGVDLAGWPVLQAYVDRLRQRPSVQQAMAEEGLAKAA